MVVYQIIYFSQGSQRLTESDLKSILKVSRLNNTKRQVTGVLIALDNCFLQLLEGSKDTVLNLFETIKKDDRHTDVLKVYQGQTSNRNFPEWSMGFEVTSLASFKKELGFVDISNRDLFIQNHLKNASHKVVRMIKRFYHI